MAWAPGVDNIPDPHDEEVEEEEADDTHDPVRRIARVEAYFGTPLVFITREQLAQFYIEEDSHDS